MKKFFIQMKGTQLLVLALVSCQLMLAQSPGGVSSGLQIWYKANAGTSTTTNGATLTTWNDQSGNGFNATQATEAAKPHYNTNVMNGNPAVHTNATRFLNFSLSSVDAHDYTMFAVTKRESITLNQFFIGSPGSGLGLGYSITNNARHMQYGTRLSMVCPSYAGALEVPTIMSAEFDDNVGRKLILLRDGVQYLKNSTGTATTPSTGAACIGRSSASTTFTGFVAEVVVYDRILTEAEKRQVQTYLSVKYGLSIPTVSHLYYNEPAFANDIFGIGRNVAGQGLNQTVSNSMNPDDILELRDPASMDDGDYLICGNNGSATSFAAYAGPDCSLNSVMSRIWKARTTGTPGTVTLRFDLTGIAGVDPTRLQLLMDADNDNNFEATYTGTYVAPYFTVTGVDVADAARFTIGHGVSTWYAVTSGNATDPIWATTPAGVPQVLASFCSRCNLQVNGGVTVTNNWPTLDCKEFNISAGGVFNAGTSVMSVTDGYVINGIFNAQTSSVTLLGTTAQTISGSGIANVYNLTVNNAAGVSIDALSGGVRARNLVMVNAGTLTTNGRLILESDASSSGMIGPLTSGDVVGEVTINRYHSATAQGWVNLCSPVQSMTVTDWNDDIITTGFIGSDYPPPYPFNNVQFYNEAVAGGMDDGYEGVNNVSDALTPYTGYFIFMNAGIMNLDVHGQIFKGNQAMPITYTNTGNGVGDGWNLISNPYPCTLDWDAVSWSKTNMDNAVYVWNAALGQYATYINGLSANGGSRYIPHTQSFIVRANNASPVLNMTENCKAVVQGTFKSAVNEGAVFTLHVSNGTYSDETTFARNENGSLHTETSIDAFKLRSPLAEVPYMASVSMDGNDMSINSFASMSEEVIIPLRVEAGAAGVYDFTHTGLKSFANGACVVLEDLATGQVYPLNQYDNISIELEAGNTDLRFQLRVGASALADITTAGCPGMSDGTASVQVDENGPYTIHWFNADGEQIGSSEDVTSVAEISGLEAGFYTVQIVNNGQCGTTEAEFVVSYDDALSATAIVVPATCQNDEDGGIALSLAGGSGNYNVTWSNGSTQPSLDNVEAGDYTVFVTDDNNCSNSFVFNIPVKAALVSSFDTQDEVYALHNGAVTVDFFNTSEDATSYEWVFGDNTISSDEENPQHLYNAKGHYTVTLVARNEECESHQTKTIRIVNPASEGTELSSSILGRMTDDGIRLMFFFDQPRNLRITAYSVLGQQLTDPIVGTYTRETITFSERRYAANSLVEVIDLTTGERAVIKMGL